MPTFYAQYNIDYATVTWNANGGTASESSRQVQKGQPVGTLPTWTRSGYTFNGWYTAASGGSKISASTVVNNNVTYYAQSQVNLPHVVTKGANFSNITVGTMGNFSGSWVTLTNLPSSWSTLRFKIIDTSGIERVAAIMMDMGSLAAQVGGQYGVTPRIDKSTYSMIISASGKAGVTASTNNYSVTQVNTYIDGELYGSDAMNFNISRS